MNMLYGAGIILTGIVVFVLLCWFIVLCNKVDEIHEAMGLGMEDDEEEVDE